MDGIRQFAVSVGCTVLLCGIVEAVAPPGTYRKALRTVMGIFLLYAVLSSASAAWRGLGEIGDLFSADNGAVTQQAEETARQQIEQAAAQEVAALVEEQIRARGAQCGAAEAQVEYRDGQFSVAAVRVPVEDAAGEAAAAAVGEALALPVQAVRQDAG